MDFVSFISKGLLVKGGVVVTGVSGASVGSWFVHESSNPSAHSKLVYEGYKYEPTLLKSNTLETTTSGSSKTFSTFVNLQDGCLKKFFPALSIEEDVADSFYTIANMFEKISPPNPNTSSSKTSGCTVMKLSTSESDSEKFVFESETLVKNDKTGIVVRGSSKNVKLTKDSKEENKLFLQYTILFLENTNDSWNIKWGAIVKEEADNTSGISKVVIKSPDGFISKTFSKLTENNESVSDWHPQYYSGIWEESNDKDASTIFEKVVVVEDESKASILGHNGNNFGGYSGYGVYLQSNHVFDKDKKKWNPYSMPIKEYLNNWFKPFKGKKGKWSDCYSKSSERNISDDTKELLKTVCYKKISS